MKGQDVMFERGLNVPDGIHDHVEFNEYRPGETRWVTIGQLVLGTLGVVALALLYALFGMLEG